MTDLHDPTLGDLVATNAAAARVLERFGLDYCCRGSRTLAEACAAAGLDAATVEAELAAVAALASDEDTGWAALDPVSLATHIVETHHRYLHDELPLVDALAAKVLAAHGTRHPELVEVRSLVAALRADLEPHLLKEERVLFPAVHALVTGARQFPFGSIGNPIRMMNVEHDRAGQLLAELRLATRGYEAPADACTSYRVLYERLAAVELDTHVHIHKENHVLFPAVLALAAS